MNIAAGQYQLKPKNAQALYKLLFKVEPKYFKIGSQQIAEPFKKRVLDINYKNYQKINSWVLPSEVLILAIEGDEKKEIAIEYRNIVFNQPMNFPYKIPKGFKEIVLSKDDI